MSNNKVSNGVGTQGVRSNFGPKKSNKFMDFQQVVFNKLENIDASIEDKFVLF